MVRDKCTLYPLSDWHEELGDCLFFHFDDFESPPTVVCASPNDDVFDESFWTHFTHVDFNHIMDQAMT